MRNIAPSALRSDATGSPAEIETRRWTTIQSLLLVIAVILGVAALYAARAFFIPVAVGVFLAVLLWPIQHALTRRMPRWLATTVVVLVVLAALAVLAGAVWYTADTIIDRFNASEATLTDYYRSARQWLVERGVYAGWLPEVQQMSADGAATGTGGGATGQSGGGNAQSEVPTRLAAWIVSFLTAGLNSVVWVFVVLGLGIGMMILLLLELPRWRARFDRVAGEPRGDELRVALGQIGYQVRRYIVAKSITGVISGVLVSLLCWAMGVPFPVTWGILQFLFNYIPNVGAFISGIPPTLLAFIELGAWPAVGFTIGLIAIEVLIGNLLDPILVGDVLRLPPSVVLAALIFWGWLWGIAGALLAVPITAAVVVALLHIPRLRAFAEVVRDSGHRPAPARGR